MKAFIITLQEPDKPEPIEAAKRCIDSIERTKSTLEPEMFEASTPRTMYGHMEEVFGKRVQWSWPMDMSKNCYDIRTGLFKKYYPARDQLRVVACAMSHVRLWKKCVDLDENIVILEQDALFTKNLDVKIFDGWEWGAIGLNDPRGATRKSTVYYDMIVKNGNIVQSIPNIDGFGAEALPMGLAGNSAYIIKPYAAKDLLNTIGKTGLWPNDALMCKQLFRWLKVCYPFFTKVQGTKSTTTG